MTDTSMNEGCETRPDAGSALGASLVRAPWRRFIVLGDVGAQGRGSARGGRSGSMRWADRVAETLRLTRPDLAYLNLGCRGHSAAQVRAKQLAKALAFRGDLAAVVAGGHEALRDPFDVDATEAELHRIVGPLRDSGADVITLGWYSPRLLAPASEEHPSGLRERLRLLAERTRELALRHGAFHVDVAREASGRLADVSDREIAAAVIRRLVTHLDATKVPA